MVPLVETQMLSFHIATQDLLDDIACYCQHLAQDLRDDFAYYFQHLAQDLRDDVALKSRRLFVLATNLGHASSDSRPAYETPDVFRELQVKK